MAGDEWTRSREMTDALPGTSAHEYDRMAMGTIDTGEQNAAALDSQSVHPTAGDAAVEPPLSLSPPPPLEDRNSTAVSMDAADAIAEAVQVLQTAPLETAAAAAAVVVAVSKHRQLEEDIAKSCAKLLSLTHKEVGRISNGSIISCARWYTR
jgi:hypothetical protein